MSHRSRTGWSIPALKQYVDRIVRDHVAVHQAEMRERNYARKGIERRLAGIGHQLRESQRREASWLSREDYDRHHQDLLQRHDHDVTALGARIDAVGTTIDSKITTLEDKLNARLRLLEDWRQTVTGRTVAALFVVGLISSVLGVIVGHIFFG